MTRENWDEALSRVGEDLLEESLAPLEKRLPARRWVPAAAVCALLAAGLGFGLWRAWGPAAAEPGGTTSHAAVVAWPSTGLQEDENSNATAGDALLPTEDSETLEENASSGSSGSAASQAQAAPLDDVSLPIRAGEVQISADLMQEMRQNDGAIAVEMQLFYADGDAMLPVEDSETLDREVVALETALGKTESLRREETQPVVLSMTAAEIEEAVTVMSGREYAYVLALAAPEANGAAIDLAPVPAPQDDPQVIYPDADGPDERGKLMAEPGRTLVSEALQAMLDAHAGEDVLFFVAAEANGMTPQELAAFLEEQGWSVAGVYAASVTAVAGAEQIAALEAPEGAGLAVRLPVGVEQKDEMVASFHWE